MAFDGFFTKKIIAELLPDLEHARINKINNISNDEFIFSIRKRKNMKLLISINSNSSRIQLTKNNYENPISPSNFCSVLRKYLTNGIITNIEQHSNDRIIFIKIKNFDELGYEKYYYLIVELMGKHSNLILTNEDKVIVESLKNSYSLEYKRSTIANMNYQLPPTKEKINPFDFDNYPAIYDSSNKKFLLQNFYGVSSFLNTYISQNYDDVLNGLKQFCLNFESFNSPSYFINNEKKDFYFLKTKFDSNITFETLSDLLDFYYMDIAKQTTNKNTDKILFNLVKNKINRLHNKLDILSKELETSLSNDDYKLKGNLLLANIYLYKKNVPTEITVQNFYSESLEDVTIELDNTLSIEKNADNYFNLYKKNKRTIDNLEQQIIITKRDIVYFETLQFQLDNADKSDIVEIKEELISQGFLKEKTNVKKKKNKTSYFIVNYNDTNIYIGRNNIQNDTITNKLAHRNYLWFHAKDIPGSHVVIFSNNPDKETINLAAQLAGYFSKFKNEEYVNVDMTLIKHVKKISGAKPGLVTYTNQTTIKTKIDKILINNIISS